MRVLLVEDDNATAQGIEMMLRSEGYVCDATDMGEDGLEIGKLYDYDIIVLDLMLPDIDGYEVLRRLRAARAVFFGWSFWFPATSSSSSGGSSGSCARSSPSIQVPVPYVA